MLPEAVLIGVVVLAAAVVFLKCCAQIARVSFGARAARADVRLALFWGLAFAATVIGCLALTDAHGNGAAAGYAVLVCVVSLAAGHALGKSWRASEAAERVQLEELRAAVESYRASEDSVEARCARVARERDLTRREEEMLLLLLEGRTRAEIARELYVSNDTVKTHIRNLYRKMGVAGKDELAQTMGT